MTNLTHLTIDEALQGLQKKEFTSVELTEAHIAAMEKARGLNAYITETPDIALKQAKESDARRAGGKAEGRRRAHSGTNSFGCWRPST